MRSVSAIISSLSGAFITTLILLVSFLVLISAPQAQAGSVWLPGIGGNNVVPVKSISERKFNLSMN